MSFTVHRILASVADRDERWAAIEDAPFNPRTGARQWTPDGAKRTRDDEVAAQVATDLLKRPAVTEHVTSAEKVRVVTELTRDDTVAQQVTTDQLVDRLVSGVQPVDQGEGRRWRCRSPVRPVRAAQRRGPEWSSIHGLAAARRCAASAGTRTAANPCAISRRGGHAVSAPCARAARPRSPVPASAPPAPPARSVARKVRR
ncbi:DUF6192 family protein [Streptomyces sp. NPDC003737]|uniref:DUF6192 family protein n=1 Tax=Streptomyces sp. NPDC003737 TaxID=3364685 RepID=UPI00367F1A73